MRIVSSTLVNVNANLNANVNVNTNVNVNGHSRLPYIVLAMEFPYLKLYRIVIITVH